MRCFGHAALIHERPSGDSFLPELRGCACKQVSIATAQPRLDFSVLAQLDDKEIMVAPRRAWSAPPGTAAARLRLVEFGKLLLEKHEQGAGVVDGQVQATARGLVVARRTGQHQHVDGNLDQAPVVLQRLQALHFDVVGLHAFSCSWATPDCPGMCFGMQAGRDHRLLGPS